MSSNDAPRAEPGGLPDWLWLIPWVALAVVPLVSHGPLPPDELRYLSVAWEMWTTGDVLVPHLNGVPYSDKPPLLFWIIDLGWHVTGVNDWWPRTLPALFALGAALLSRRLCRLLWPTLPAAARIVPWLFVGSMAVSIYTQVLLFDLLLVDWTLLGLIGYWRAGHGDSRGWLLVVAATALGILTKGPATYLHLGGAAVFAPWWLRPARPGRWYLRAGLALLGGGIVALAWAIPAAVHGGPEYAGEILFAQTAGRMTQSFAHARPFWFFAWVLPLLLLPWSIWPGAWAALRDAWADGRRDTGARLLAATIVPTFICFSAVSGKQPHYVLPLIPLVCALIAAAFAHRSAPGRTVTPLAPLVVTGALTVLFAMLPRITSGLTVLPWSPIPGVAAGLALLVFARRAEWPVAVRRLAVAAPVLIVVSETAFFSTNAPAFELGAIGARAGEIEADGLPLAWVGAYDGELGFSGRLLRPVDLIERDPAAIAAWAASHPDGFLVETVDAEPVGAELAQPHRGGWLALRRAADALR